MVYPAPPLAPGLPAFGGRTGGQGRRQKQERNDHNHEHGERSPSTGARDGEPRTERAEHKQPQCDADQNAEHVKPVEGKELTGQAESEWSDGKRGGNAVEDIRQPVKSARGSEAQQEGVTGEKQSEERATRRAGHFPRQQRKSEGDDEKRQTAQQWMSGLRHGSPPSP